MRIPLTCGACGRDFSAPDSFAGRKVVCPDCGAGVKVKSSGVVASHEYQTDDQRPPARRARGNGLSPNVAFGLVGVAAVVIAGGIALNKLPSLSQLNPVVTTSPAIPPQIPAPESAETVSRGKTAEEGFPRVLDGHAAAVLAVCVSPDSKFVYSASEDATVRAWDVSTGNELWQFTGPGGLGAVRCSPNGELVAAGCDQDVYVLDAASDKRIQQMKAAGGVQGVTFTPDSRQVVGAAIDATARLWEIDSGEPIRLFRGSGSGFVVPQITPDGAELFVGAGSGIHRWKLQTGGRLPDLEGHHAAVIGLSLTPDGRYALSASDDKLVGYWDALSGTLIQMLKGHTGRVMAADFFPSGRHAVSAGLDQKMILWNLDARQKEDEWPAHEGSLGVRGLAVAPDGKFIVSGGYDSKVRLWKPPVDSSATVVPASPESQRKETASESPVSEQPAEGVSIALSGHAGAVICVVAHPDGKHVLSASDDGTVRGWDVVSGEEVLKVSTKKPSGYFCVACSPDGKLFAGGSMKGEINVYEFPSGQLVHSFDDQEKMIQAVAFTADNHSLFSGSVDSSISSWDLRTGKPLRGFRGNASGVTSLLVTPDGKEIVSGGGDGVIRIGTLKPVKLRAEWPGHDGPVYGLAISPDGNLLASAGGDKTVRVRRLNGKKNEKETQILHGHEDRVMGVGFLPDGRRLVSGGFDKKMIVWDLTSGQPVKEWPAHNHSSYGVRSIAVSFPGEFIASSGYDAKVRLWKLKGDPQPDPSAADDVPP